MAKGEVLFGLDKVYVGGSHIGSDVTEVGFEGNVTGSITVGDLGNRLDVTIEDPGAISSGVFNWKRSSASNGTYLYNYGSGPTPSNLAGIPLFFTPAKLDKLSIACQSDNITFTINLYAHSGGALTLIHTQIVTLGVGVFDAEYIDLNKAITGGRQVAAQLEYTGAKPSNVEVNAGIIKG